MPIPALVDGLLPMGRWVCRTEEVEAAFVPKDSDVRATIWADWVILSAAPRGALGEVPACWMSGSFFSDKTVPGDIDCLWIVNTHVWSQRLNWRDPTLAEFMLNCAGGRVKSAYGLKVDSYVLEWIPTPGPEPHVSAHSYFGNRGYWDKLWTVQFRSSP